VTAFRITDAGRAAIRDYREQLRKLLE
jgi:DNA-binding PadR family transcriptional regulator